MNRVELLIVALIAGIFSFLFYNATRVNYYVLQLDSAYLLELVDNTFQGGIPATYLGKSVVAVNPTFSAPPERVCSATFDADNGPPLNNFERHSYLIVYLLAGFRFVFTSAQVVGLFQVLAFPGLLLAVYLVARREGMGPGQAAAVVLLTAAHPAWSYAAYGQFYADKYFMLPGFLASYLVYRRLAWGDKHAVLLVILWLLAASTSERPAIMLGVFGLGALVLWRGGRNWRRPDTVVTALALLTLVYAGVYMGWQNKNADYASFGSGALAWLSRRAYLAPALWKFLLINLALFWVLSIPAWRTALLAMGALLPNVVGDIGGAEKLGWTTHYHAVYFPFLVLAVLLGHMRICAWPGGRMLSAAAPCLLALVLLCLNPFTLPRHLDLSVRSVREAALLKTVEFNSRSGAAAGAAATSEWYRLLAASVPAGSVVTTAEGGMPALYGSGRRLYYYPEGLDAAEYAVLPYAVGAGGARQYLGAVSYLGPEAAGAVNKCLSTRVTSQFEVLAEFPAISAAVLKRRPASQPKTVAPAKPSL